MHHLSHWFVFAALTFAPPFEILATARLGFSARQKALSSARARNRGTPSRVLSTANSACPTYLSNSAARTSPQYVWACNGARAAPCEYHAWRRSERHAQLEAGPVASESSGSCSCSARASTAGVGRVCGEWTALAAAGPRPFRQPLLSCGSPRGSFRHCGSGLLVRRGAASQRAAAASTSALGCARQRWPGAGLALGRVVRAQSPGRAAAPATVSHSELARAPLPPLRHLALQPGTAVESSRFCAAASCPARGSSSFDQNPRLQDSTLSVSVRRLGSRRDAVFT